MNLKQSPYNIIKFKQIARGKKNTLQIENESLGYIETHRKQ